MRKAGLLAGAGLMLWQGMAFALGLGNVQLHSHLGEKLAAEAPVVGLDGLHPADIKVSLADQASHQKLGIDYLPFHEKLRFEVRPAANNAATLFIKSKDTVKEPYLHFVVQIDYPQGKMMKDISLLLDAPNGLPPIADK